MGLDLGSIEFYAGPTVLGGPDDLDAVVRSFISGAEKRSLIAVQELDSRAIAEAILAAKVASVRVQLILEGDYLAEDPPVADPWAEVGDNEDNRRSTRPCCAPVSTSSPISTRRSSTRSSWCGTRACRRPPC
jgi:hypothetical protein